MLIQILRASPTHLFGRRQASRMRVCRTHVANNPLLLGMELERIVRQRNQLPTNLPQLQNLIKRDGDLYKDEVAITQ